MQGAGLYTCKFATAINDDGDDNVFATGFSHSSHSRDVYNKKDMNNGGNTNNKEMSIIAEPNNTRNANNSMLLNITGKSAIVGRQATAGNPSVVDTSGKLIE